MSAIPIHTQSPISPAKATAITPQTSYNPAPTTSSTPATTTQSSTSTNGYSSARPGAAAPTPTQSIPSQTVGIPAPQPGALPTPTAAAPSSRARGSSIPPPPKVGEKPQPPSFYTPSQAEPTPTPSTTVPSQTYPYQMGIPPPGPAYNGVPPASTTSTTQTPSFPTPASLQSGSEPVASGARARPRANTLEHPPGYIQNPQAQEMTSDARFATEQQANNNSERSPVLPGYSDHKAGGNAGFGEEEGIWDMAKKLVSQAGEKVQEFEGEVWRKFGDRK